jgi:hypothetical protein
MNDADSSKNAVSVFTKIRPTITRDFRRMRIENLYFASGFSLVHGVMPLARDWQSVERNYSRR